MTYRLATDEDWPKIAEVLEPHGFIMPPRQGSEAAIAENGNGTIEGVLFLQLAVHMEPLILNTPHASFLRLAECLQEGMEKFKGLTYYVFTDNEVTEGMASRVGMRKTPYSVWKAEVA